jgi:hypothetical protein
MLNLTTCYLFAFEIIAFVLFLAHISILIFSLNKYELGFRFFLFGRTWWKLFQKHVMRTKFDIYVFITRFTANSPISFISNSDNSFSWFTRSKMTIL